MANGWLGLWSRLGERCLRCPLMNAGGNKGRVGRRVSTSSIGERLYQRRRRERLADNSPALNSLQSIKGFKCPLSLIEAQRRSNTFLINAGKTCQPVPIAASAKTRPANKVKDKRLCSADFVKIGPFPSHSGSNCIEARA